LPKVRFLAFVRRTAGVENFNIIETDISVRQALEIVGKKYPQLKELILDEVPEVSFILGERSLLIPKDLELPFTKDLIIGPIVAGGYISVASSRFNSSTQGPKSSRFG